MLAPFAILLFPFSGFIVALAASGLFPVRQKSWYFLLWLPISLWSLLGTAAFISTLGFLGGISGQGDAGAGFAGLGAMFVNVECSVRGRQAGCFPAPDTRAVILKAAPTPAPAAQDPRCRVPAASRQTHRPIRRPGSLSITGLVSGAAASRSRSLRAHPRAPTFAQCARPFAGILPAGPSLRGLEKLGGVAGITSLRFVMGDAAQRQRGRCPKGNDALKRRAPGEWLREWRV